MHLPDAVSAQVIERESSPLGAGEKIQPANSHTNNDDTGASTPPSLFKQRINGKATPSQVPILSATADSAPAVETPSKSRLGTVSFYSKVTNARSPRMALIPQSHRGRPLVQVQEGERVPYDDWWRTMQRSVASGPSIRIRFFDKKTDRWMKWAWQACILPMQCDSFMCTSELHEESFSWKFYNILHP